MEIEYLSDDEQRGEATKDCQSSDGAFYYCDSIDSINNYVKVESMVDKNLHQIINYPSLEKKTLKQIINICNDIDLIDLAIRSKSKVTWGSNHASKPIVKSIDGPPIKLKTKSIRRLNRWNRRKN